MSDTVVVARRELVDVVDRVLRVEGVDPGAARHVAAATAHGQAAGHDAAEAIVALIDRGAVDDLLEAHDAIFDAELAARRDGSAQVEFRAPVPEALLLGPLAESAQRGVHRVSSSSLEGLVSAIGLRHRPDGPPPSTAPPHHELPLPRPLFDDLARRAAAFLVAESVLDALPAHEPGTVAR